MVTRDRPVHAARAAQMFLRQTYRPCELVIVDDGGVDYTAHLPSGSTSSPIRYVRIGDGVTRSLGEMRNLSLDLAAGDWWMQWDDDDWYHPDRIAVQLDAARRAGANGSALRWTLMHVDAPGLTGWPFRVDTGFATPGTMLHRRTELRYPSIGRGEDSALMGAARREGRIEVLGRREAHLFARCYHGANTWDRAHFVRRLHRRPLDWPSWAVASIFHRDIRRHRAFTLTAVERGAARLLLDDLAVGQ